MEERRMTNTMLIFVFLVVLYASIPRTHAADTISANQNLRYNETITSPQETFELGFFSSLNSKNHYVGIWYKKISTGTVVWVANRNTPLTHTSVELTLTLHGVLVIRETTTGNVIWSSAISSTKSVSNPIGQLLDTGNFVIYNEGDKTNQEDPIWQGFDFMTDTLLPGMKQGRDFVTGVERYYTSWRSKEDPGSGEFSTSIDTRGYPQPIRTQGQKITYRVGPWNGLRFSGAPHLSPNPIYSFTFVINEREIYYQYNLINTSVFTRMVLQPNGNIERLLWIDSKQEWNLYLTPEIDHCDRYAMCGPYSSCNIGKSPVCECLKGFEPTSPDQWRVADWSQGC
ncbi:putative S-locus glycoprotein [Helianthus annuus]|nr:putative S-locus glycoprotein [Helianthus annuus]